MLSQPSHLRPLARATEHSLRTPAVAVGQRLDCHRWPESTQNSRQARAFSPNQLADSNTASFIRPAAMRPPVTTFWRHRISTQARQYSHASSTPTSSTADTTPAGRPIIHDIFEAATGTWQYIVADPATLHAVIIDPVLDFEPASRTISTASADRLLALVAACGYRITHILETHVHADHLTSASYLQRRLVAVQEEGGNDGGRPLIGIGRRITQVQRLFAARYRVPAAEWEGVFDVLFEDNECFHVGKLKATAVHLPGHTPDHMGYRFGPSGRDVFCGDSLFHPDIGTARTDFPGGSAGDLWRSARKLLYGDDDAGRGRGRDDEEEEEKIKIWTGHDYPPPGRKQEETPTAWTSVGEHRRLNAHVGREAAEEAFVKLRKERDAKLGEPRLLHQSLQWNIRAGRMPVPDSETGKMMLRLPLKLDKGIEPW